MAPKHVVRNRIHGKQSIAKRQTQTHVTAEQRRAWPSRQKTYRRANETIPVRLTVSTLLDKLMAHYGLEVKITKLSVVSVKMSKNKLLAFLQSAGGWAANANTRECNKSGIDKINGVVRIV